MDIASLLIAGIYWVITGILIFLSAFSIYVLMRYGRNLFVTSILSLLFFLFFLNLLTQSYQTLQTILS